MVTPEELADLSAAETIFDPRPVQSCPRCREMRFLDDFEGFKNCLSCRIRMRRRNRIGYERLKKDPRRYARKLQQAAENGRRRKARAKIDPEFREHVNAVARRLRAKRRSDPRRHAADLENRRIRDAIRRREAGAREMPQRSPLRLVDRSRDSVPVGPFRRWLFEKIEAEGDGFLSRMNVPQRSLYRAMHESDWVEIDLVDRVLVHEGSTFMFELYPDLYSLDENEAA